MWRREFIAALGGAAAWPLAARAQQPAPLVVGFVSGGSADASADGLRAFRNGLSATGYVEGQNVAVEYHWLEALMADPGDDAGGDWLAGLCDARWGCHEFIAGSTRLVRPGYVEGRNIAFESRWVEGFACVGVNHPSACCRPFGC